MTLPIGETVEDRQHQRHEHEEQIEDRLRQQERQDQLTARALKHATSRSHAAHPDGRAACMTWSYGFGVGVAPTAFSDRYLSRLSSICLIIVSASIFFRKSACTGGYQAAHSAVSQWIP